MDPMKMVLNKTETYVGVDYYNESEVHFVGVLNSEL
jgi:hypothetical protein